MTDPDSAEATSAAESPPVASDERSLVLSERTRNGVSSLLVGLALVHVIFPRLAIDAVFLGLLAFASLVKLFDIESIHWLGIKARKRSLLRQAEQVKQLPIAKEPPRPATPPVISAGIAVTAEPDATVHREALDLMPPVDRTERLLWAAEQIRIELIILAGSAGLLPERTRWDSLRSRELAVLLAERDVISKGLVRPVASVVEQRNALAHGRTSLPAAASELALEILVKLRATPRNYIRVADYPVQLFGDRSLTTPHEYAVGICLEQRDKDGKVFTAQVFPVASAYKRGRYVTWEWDFTRVANLEAWYLDRQANQPRLAFSSSALFVGREFPDQWGVRYRASGAIED